MLFIRSGRTQTWDVHDTINIFQHNGNYGNFNDGAISTIDEIMTNDMK